MSQRWQVQVAPGSYEGVLADYASTKDGDLCFYVRDGRLVLAYARGSWLTAFQDDRDA